MFFVTCHHFQPSSFIYRVKEGETISIKFTVTVPVGCIDQNRQYLCKTSVFILTPEYQSSTSSCQNFSKQGEVSFEENGCGIIKESSNWWKERILNVTGKTDGLINKRDRDVFIKLGSLTESPDDISGVWYNFTMPDIKVFQLLIFKKQFLRKGKTDTVCVGRFTVNEMNHLK